MNQISVYVDGGSRGNPGPSAIGVVVKDDSGTVVKAFGKYIGIATNNIAEYTAVVYGLQEALFKKSDNVSLFLDSELAAKQLTGEYRVKDKNIKPLFEIALHMVTGIKKVTITHIPREKNKEADKQVNKALNLETLL